MVRKAWVPTSQLLGRVQIDRDTDSLWLETKLVPRGSRQLPALSGAILGLTTMEWTCVWNGVEIFRKAGVPALQLLVPVQIDSDIDGLWLE